MPDTNYFIFANYPDGEYDGSFWDTSNILETGEYYFTLKDKLTYKPVPNDIIIFKEFKSKTYWGEAVVDVANEQVKIGNEEVIRFRLKSIKKWLFSLNTDLVYDSLSNKDTRARIVNITQQDYQLIIKEMRNNSPLNEERQAQLKKLWKNYCSRVSKNFEQEKEAELLAIKKKWNIYREKLIDGSFNIDDYTNTLSNLLGKPSMPEGYLCNFLERGSSSGFGNAKPGNATRFGVKLNNDNETYTIGTNKPKAARAEAEEIFNNDIKPLLTDIVSAANVSDKIRIVEERSSIMKARQLLNKMIVLDHELDFIFIYSTDWVNSLYDEMIQGQDKLNLEKNATLLKMFTELFELKNTFADHSLLSGFLWSYSTTRSIVDSGSPNVILYGPPGTGKTYTIKNALDFVCQGDKSRYEFIQFHPSYTYEDFIEGIKPKGVTPDGNIKFELVNGIFKSFCMKAKQKPDIEHYFVIDEINRANLSSVFGETLVCLEKDYRHNPKKEESGDDNLIKTQYATLIEQLPQEQRANLSYATGSSGESYFGVPSNVYVIGMMNDVDKSIDAFDLALRRRFKWVRMDCDYEVILEKTKFSNGEDFENISQYVEACKKLNTFISDDLVLGKSYEFGHSFFMKIDNIAKRKAISKRNLENLFNLHLRPTLKEYLRAIYAEKDLDRRLDEAMEKFTTNVA